MTESRAIKFRQPKIKGESIPISQSPEPSLGLIIGAGQHVNPRLKSRRFDLVVIDLDDFKGPLSLIPMSFFGHGVSPDPANPERVSVFEKRGKGACEIDLKAGKVTRLIKTKSHREFYGHGAYSPDGELLYATETVTEGDFDGVVAVRDAKTHDYLGEFPSFGSRPHDCHLIEGGTVMVITNGGGPRGSVAPSVTYVDVKNQQLLDKYELENPNINAGHLNVTSSGGLAVVSAQREGMSHEALGGISLKLANGELHTLKEPSSIIKKLSGETLSVCIHEETGVVGTTTPAGNALLFWDLASGELIRQYKLQNPRGIQLTQNRKYFVVSYGMTDPTEAMCLISTETLERELGFDFNPTFITGSHLFSYSLPAALRA